MTWRFGWIGMRKARRSSEKPAPRRVAVMPAGAAQAHRLALEIEQLLRVDLAADGLDRLEQPPLERGELLDLVREARRDRRAISHAASSESAIGGVAGRPR